LLLALGCCGRRDGAVLLKGNILQDLRMPKRGKFGQRHSAPSRDIVGTGNDVHLQNCSEPLFDVYRR
jgi:hypothetical protein